MADAPTAPNPADPNTGAPKEEPHGSTDTGTAEPPKADTDWTAEARKWESRAKANKAAADELATLKAAQMSDAEKAAQKLADTEARAVKAETEATRLRVATTHGLSANDAELFLTAPDEDGMNAQAKRYAELAAATSKPDPLTPNPAQGNRAGKGNTGSNRERFAELFED